MTTAPTSVSGDRSAWMKASILLIVSFFVVATLATQVRPGAEAVAVVFPPWWSTERTITAAAAAEASVIRTGALSSIIIVQPARENGLTKLRTAGAWLTLDPQAIAACFPASPTTPLGGQARDDHNE
jgi:hypothetical protein